MTGGDAPLPAETDGGFRNRLKAVGMRIVGFVGVKIEVEIAIARQAEHPVQRCARIGIVNHDGSQDAAMIGDEIGKPLALLPRVAVEHGERHALQGNAAGPTVAHSAPVPAN